MNHHYVFAVIFVVVCVEVLLVPEYVMEGFILTVRHDGCSDFTSPESVTGQEQFIQYVKDKYFCKNPTEECVYDLEFRSGEKVHFGANVLNTERKCELRACG
jgi:hypothetical protein